MCMCVHTRIYVCTCTHRSTSLCAERLRENANGGEPVARTAGINKGGDHRIANVSKRNIILFKRLQGGRLGARLFRRSRGWGVEMGDKGDGRTATVDDAGDGMLWGMRRGGGQSFAFSLFA